MRLAFAEADLSRRCFTHAPTKRDVRSLERDVHEFRQIASRWPPLWVFLGLKEAMPPPGGWGAAGPPTSLGTFLDLGKCRIPEAATLLARAGSGSGRRLGR